MSVSAEGPALTRVQPPADQGRTGRGAGSQPAVAGLAAGDLLLAESHSHGQVQRRGLCRGGARGGEERKVRVLTEAVGTVKPGLGRPGHCPQNWFGGVCGFLWLVLRGKRGQNRGSRQLLIKFWLLGQLSWDDCWASWMDCWRLRSDLLETWLQQVGPPGW